MKIGVPKEIKNHEYRVGLVPSSVQELVAAGHEVLVERGSGLGVGIADTDYQAAGASIVKDAATVFNEAELIVKVKEPQLSECAMLKPHHTLFTYLHLAADPDQAKALQRSGATAIAYETVTADDGSLPLLTPMSEVAGRMSIQVGAYSLQKASGGAGVLLGGVPGVEPAKVVILGGGVAGTNAAEMAWICVIRAANAASIGAGCGCGDGRRLHKSRLRLRRRRRPAGGSIASPELAGLQPVRLAPPSAGRPLPFERYLQPPPQPAAAPAPTRGGSAGRRAPTSARAAARSTRSAPPRCCGGGR